VTGAIGGPSSYNWIKAGFAGPSYLVRGSPFLSLGRGGQSGSGYIKSGFGEIYL